MGPFPGVAGQRGDEVTIDSFPTINRQALGHVESTKGVPFHRFKCTSQMLIFDKILEGKF